MKTDDLDPKMGVNTVMLMGTAIGDSELRKISSERPVLYFDLYLDEAPGWEESAGSYRIRCAFFAAPRDVPEIKSGDQVSVIGELRHRRDSSLFVAVHQLSVSPKEDPCSPPATPEKP